MTYRVRCKRRQRMPAWAMNVDLDAMTKQRERHGTYSDLDLPLPRSFPKRRAWPAVSRKDADIQAEAESRLLDLLAGNYAVMPISYYGKPEHETIERKRTGPR